MTWNPAPHELAFEIPFWKHPQWCASCDKPLLPLDEEPKGDFGCVLCAACAGVLV